MRRVPSSHPFRFSHGAWSSLPGQDLGEKAVLRQLIGGESLNWRLDLAAGARLASPGLKCECMLSVWTGRAQCGLLGNQVDLPAGHFALVPPNVPFTLRATGNESCVVVGTLCQPTPHPVLFEPQ
ncbi:MAG: hypothetical protein HRF46_10585 [Acidobacteriota bacterium]